MSYQVENAQRLYGFDLFSQIGNLGVEKMHPLLKLYFFPLNVNLCRIKHMVSGWVKGAMIVFHSPIILQQICLLDISFPSALENVAPLVDKPGW